MDSILVRDYIYEIWHDENTALYFQEVILTMEEDSRTIAYQAILSFLESMWIDCLETKGPGGAVQPTFNVFADGSIIDNNHTWSNIRTYLANHSYHSSRLGQGRAVIALNHCGLCHGADHPKGMCPFPMIDGWKGPRKGPPPPSQKKGTNLRPSGRTFPDAHH